MPKETKADSFFDVAEKMLAQLPQRAQEILKKRFGLMDSFSVQTLEKIGSDYSITRERVRQIISDAKKTISNKKYAEVDFQKVEDRLFLAVEKKCGIIKEEDVLAEFNLSGLEKEKSAMRFLVDFSQRIKVVSEKNIVEKTWATSEDVLAKVLKIANTAQELLEKKKQLLSDDEISKELMTCLPEFSKKELLSYLSVLSGIKKNKFGKWGMRQWPEVTPKGSREKIYLILKEEKKPLHFTAIAKLIEKYKLGTKKVHPQTIHNELIKDPRFVLIGRGIYALGEWGYSGGAVKDVLEGILAKSEKPLDREEIIEKVLEVRKVKRTTIMINLNGKNFEKEGTGYRLKK
ncbi:MAG: HTH domain-containing protein [Candidatus Moranbacteria bacterium]|nr:HTH domain-containing protein [Candidatus Moranbacteria bacterium]